MSLVTLVVDTSCDTKGFSSLSSNAGFSYFCYSPRGSKTGGGKLKSLVKNSLEASAMSVVNALHIAIQYGLVLSGDTILLKLRARETRMLLDARIVSADRSQIIKDVYYSYKKLRNSYNLRVLFKHLTKEDACFVKARTVSRYYRLHGKSL